MKRSIVFALLIAGSPAVAQQPATEESNEVIRLLPGKRDKTSSVASPDTTGNRLQDIYQRMRTRSLLPQAVYSHNTPRGKVYKLPIDNMPCLVPDMQQVTPMPGQYHKMPESRMPNAIPRQRIIPRERDNNPEEMKENKEENKQENGHKEKKE